MDELKKDENLSIIEEPDKENVEVWEDVVNIKSLVLSLFICSITALGSYFIAPNEPPKPLFFGLSGAVMGFIICSILIKPKRIFQQAEEGE